MTSDVKDLLPHPRVADDAFVGYRARQIRDLFSVLEAQAAEIERLTTARDLLADENTELRYQPWPEWASKVLAVIRARSGFDGYDDALDGVDLPAELEETMAELEREAERQTQDVRAARETDLHKAAADHYRKTAAEHRARTEATERERDALKATVDRLKGALALAANRLDRMALEDMPLKADADDWAQSARSALNHKGERG